MTEVLKAINPNIAAFVLVGLCLVCSGGLVLIFIMQFIGFGLDIIAGILQLVFGVITGGPIAWCGCLIFLLVGGTCGFLTIVLASVIPKCGTPEAINLCRLIGS